MSILSKKSEALLHSGARSASNDVKRKAQQAASQGKDGVLEIANEAGQKVREIFNHYSDDLEHTKEVIEDNIRNKPLQSSLIALGAGVLLGLLIRR